MTGSEQDINPFAEEDKNDLDSSRATLTSPPHTGLDEEPLEPPPLPTKPTSPAARAQSQLHFQSKTDFCCDRDRWLHSDEDVEIEIVDAQKTSEGSNASYITYIIRAAGHEARRRYSEFESLRSGLAKLYPTLIIPPIPSKTTIGDYAVKQSKAKEDINMIARRKRLLHSFLNRIAKHPVLNNEHVFHRFLQSDVSWSEVLHSPPLSLLPKNLLKAPAHSPTDTSAPQLYAALPTPSAAQSLRNPDQRFLDSEVFTDKFASHVSGPMEKVTRRTMKRWTEFAQDHADLGAALNGFSLNEEGALAASLEKTGQAIDATYLSTSVMLQDLESSWAEPLHEYSQFAYIIKKLLMFRHQKHVQYEMTQQGIESRKEQLKELERIETEARRLETALNSGRVGDTSTHRPEEDANDTNGVRAGPPSPPKSDGGGLLPSTPPAQSTSPPRDGDIAEQDQDRFSETTSTATPDYTDLPAYTPAPVPKRRATPGMGLLNALSYTIHGMMDVDPETARRNNITKTREGIAQLEDGLQASVQDLKFASSTIQTDLDRFQRQKVADIRDMAIAMALAHREWCKKNLEAWEELRKEVVKIAPHPNDVAAKSQVIDQGSGPSPGGVS